MNALRAANAWFDRVPWYVDGLVCLIPGVAVAVLCWLAWGEVSVFAFVVLPVAVLTGRYGYHRRLSRTDQSAPT